MGIRYYILFITSFLNSVVLAQPDSVAYTADLKINDGVYLSYHDFRKNNSITKDQIVSNLDKDQLDFMGKTLFNNQFSYKQNDVLITMESKKAWAYVQNNTFYINYRGDFYRIPVFGSISYLVANVTVVMNGFYDPRFGYMGSTTTKELREFIMNYYDGIMVEISNDRVEALLSRDAELYGEFKKLSHRKQKEQLYKYIRKYNEQHPVYFLK